MTFTIPPPGTTFGQDIPTCKTWKLLCPWKLTSQWHQWQVYSASLVYYSPDISCRRRRMRPWSNHQAPEGRYRHKIQRQFEVGIVMNWHFSHSFTLFFLTLTIFIIQGLILSNITRSFQTHFDCLLCSQITKTRVFSPINIANSAFILQWTTRFKQNETTSSIV